MRRTITINDCGKGLNADLLPAELELGVWSNVVNFRAKSGFMERWEGETSVTMSGVVFSSPPYFYDFLDGEEFVVVNGGAIVHYDWSSSTATTITRYRASETISTLNRLGANSAEVTTGSAHGLATNDKVTVFGATESGYNEVDATITVTSSTKFTYTTTNAIAANATVVGEYVVTSSSVTSSVSTADASKWSGGVFQGIAILNDSANGIWYWNGDTSNKFRRFGFLSYKADYCGIFREYLVQLQPTMSGTKYPYRVLWSSAAEPGSIPSSFTSSATNDAGFQDLPYAGPLLACLPLGDTNYLYSRNAIVAMRWVGGEFVFSFNKTADTGIVSPHAVCDVPGVGHVFVTPSLDVRLHQGGATRSIADGFVRNSMREFIASAGGDYTKFLACYNPQKNEVWITPGEVVIGVFVLVWDIESGKWGKFDPGSSTGYYTYLRRCLLPSGTTNKRIQSTIVGGKVAYLVKSHPESGDGTTIYGSDTCTLERTGLHMDIRDMMKTIHRSRWNMDGATQASFLPPPVNPPSQGAVSISHGSSRFPDTAPTYSSAATLTIGTTDYVSQRSLSGRYLAIKLTSSDYPIKVRSIDLDITTEGER